MLIGAHSGRIFNAASGYRGRQRRSMPSTAPSRCLEQLVRVAADDVGHRPGAIIQGPSMHDDLRIDYSLASSFPPVSHGIGLARRLPLSRPIRARVLRDAAEIGTLAVGSSADVTVL
jgi:hypothetical protein